MDLNLRGKVAIVTGGASGLGGAISELLAAEGCNVVVNYIVDEANVFRFVDKINEKYEAKATPLRGDITSTKDIENIIATADSIYNRIDILVNNAGVWPHDPDPVQDMADEEWERIVRINLSGTFFFSKRMVQYLLARKSRGKIINIVSQAAFHGSTTGHAHYASAKGGVVTFTVSLAREVARHGINVLAVAPGMMKTPMTKEIQANREEMEYYNKRIPLQRMAEPEEVANVVVFLASEKADYITGATIDATGGMLMR